MPGGGGGKKGGGGDQTVGFRYYLGLHMVVSHSPVDAVTEIQVGGRTAWSGSQTGNGTIQINAPDLFGGDDREGGVVGPVDVAFGGATQAPNGYLAAHTGVPQPAYRGVLGLIWRQVHLVSNNPRVMPIAIRVKRTFAGWNPGAKEIAGGANPAHIIYECLTSTAFGMGYPAGSVDDASFTAAAATLVSEGFGLNLIWTQQQPIEDFVREVLDHIGGVLRASPVTGRFELKLIRDDYDPGSLLVLDEDNVISLESYQRASWGETINEIIVVYTRALNFEETSITVQDLANVQIQGVVSETRQYPGITSDALAHRVAIRDLTAVSTPLAKATLVVNRDAWDLLPGDVFKLSWADLGIVQLIMRVASIDTGELADGSIRIEAVEDSFAFRDNAFTVPEPVGFIDPTPEPTDATPRLLLEAPYWDIVTNVPQAILDTLDPTDAFLQVLGGRPVGGAINIALHTQPTGGAWGFDTARGSMDFAPHATLTPALLAERTSNLVPFTAGVDVDLVQVGTYGYIQVGGNGGLHEAVEITAVDLVAGTVSLRRGVIDTVPKAHAAGARLWFSQQFFGVDLIEYATSESVQARLRTRTPLGVLELASTAIEAITLDQRQDRPYAPGGLTINGVAYPPAFEGEFFVRWKHRDRLQQTVTLPNQEQDNIGPEAGVTYTLRIYGETDALQRTFSGLTVPQQNYTEADDLADNGLGRLSSSLRLELESVRSGLVSHQTHDLLVDRPGWGWHWGEHYGGEI